MDGFDFQCDHAAKNFEQWILKAFEGLRRKGGSTLRKPAYRNIDEADHLEDRIPFTEWVLVVTHSA